jgi:hypothetical protein
MICRICRQEIASPEILFGVISPWIRDLAKVSNRLTRLVICSECKGAGFTITYDNAQMNNLYSGYRGFEYGKKRKKWEAWYTSEYNAAHENDEFINERMNKIKGFIQEQGTLDFSSVLDVGGDRGQYIPQFESVTKKYVLEKSNRKLMSGVIRVNDLAEVDSVDLVIYAHILEHVNDPMKEIEELSKISRYIYIEVPSGIPRTSKLRKSRIFQMLVVLASLFPRVWTNLCSPAAGRGVTVQILRQSEHLNFFTTESLKVLANKLNLICTIQECDIPTPDLRTARVIQVFLSKR